MFSQTSFEKPAMPLFENNWLFKFIYVVATAKIHSQIMKGSQMKTSKVC